LEQTAIRRAHGLRQANQSASCQGTQEGVPEALNFKMTRCPAVHIPSPACGGGLGWGLAGRGKRGCYRLKNAVTILQNLVIPEANDSPALASEISIALPIIPFTMLSAIGLNDELGFDAHEIGDVGRYWVLPPEAPTELITTQLVPQRALCIGHVAAQVLTAPCH
jgi:hypothetical protein